MLKYSHFRAETEHGPGAIPLFSKADAVFEKTASAQLLPEVTNYIAGLSPRKDSQYVLVNAMGAGEYYGCFPAGTLVETLTGEVPIEQVEPGQLVRTHKNRFRPVVARTPKQAGELCDLYVQGLPVLVPALTATPNHELWVVTRNEMREAKKKVWHRYAGSLVERLQRAVSELEFEWSPISELQPGDYIAEPFPLEEDPQALGDECWNTPEVAFLMGLYAAEGCIAYRYDRADEEPASIIYVVSGTEQSTIRHARECAAVLDHSLQDYPSESGTSVRLQICFKKLAALCLAHIGTPATDKILSRDILRMPRAWQQTFFDAYAKGDGCIRKSGKDEGGIRCVSASPRLLMGMRLLVARLGYVASISGRHNTKASWYNGNPVYELAISGGQFRERTAGAHGGPKSYLHPSGFILSAVKKTKTYDWSGQVYDLTVEEDASFTASGIAVHNSNVNGDYFSEASLIHAPDDWSGNPVFDRLAAKNWPYGYPTFYRAHPYAHHRNKDSSRAFGEVELAAWNPQMRRVELVARVDRDKCAAFGGQGTWDKLRSGAFPDVSMGTKVPFDTCFPAGTLVRTSAGHQPIEDLHPGDEVLTHTGSTRRVTQVMQRQAEGLTIVRAAGLPEIRSTDNHPFLVLRREQARTCKGTVNGQRCRHSFDGLPKCRRCGQEPEFDLVWSAAENLKPGDYLAMPVTCGTTHISSERARLLGYYLGDGYIIRQRIGKTKKGDYRDMGVSFSVGHTEESHLEELLKTLRSVSSANDPCVYEAGAGRRAFIVSLYDQDLAAWVQGLGGRGSDGKRLADEVFEWEAAAKIQLVAGYIDTDGSFDEASGQIRIASVNRGLLLDVQRVLLSLGCPASVCFAGSGGGYEGSSDCWYLSLSAFQAQAFRDVTCKVKGRRVGWDSPQSFLWRNYWLTPVKSVSEEDVETKVFNISVEEDESYIAEGRAVHNCSICLDKDRYQTAMETFDPVKHRHPGIAILDYHKSMGAIRGLSITRADYCEHALKMMNRIFPDGRKAFVLNDWPAFFDISFVFIGADKTAKTMLFIFSSSVPHSAVRSSAEVAEDLGVEDPGAGVTKAASVDDLILKQAFGHKVAKQKKGEIAKDIVPSQFAGKAVPLLTQNEEELPNETIDQLSSIPPENLLSTLGGMGALLRPREFQRMTLIQLGKRDLADELDQHGEVFERSNDREDMGVKAENFMPALAELLTPIFAKRSFLAPEIERRVVMSSMKEDPKTASAPSHSKDLLDKIAAAYNGYRQDVMELAAHSQHLLSTVGTSNPLRKVASVPVGEVYSPLSAAYLRYAYEDEFGTRGNIQTGGSRRVEGSPF